MITRESYSILTSKVILNKVCTFIIHTETIVDLLFSIPVIVFNMIKLLAKTKEFNPLLHNAPK